jgi:hypothetical protein
LTLVRIGDRCKLAASRWTAFWPFVFRAIDHQSTLGAFVGKIALKNGHGTMVDFKYVDGASALPSDAEVKKLRSAVRRTYAARSFGVSSLGPPAVRRAGSGKTAPQSIR